MYYRKLTDKDAEAYLEIRREAVKEYPKAFASSYEEMQTRTVDQIREQLQSYETEDHFILGVFSDATLCGVVSFNRQALEKMHHKGALWGVYVQTAYQGQGLAKKLMIKALEEIEQLDGVEQVNLMVNMENERARRLYRSLGFEPYGVEKKAMKIEGEYFDEELMVYFV